MLFRVLLEATPVAIFGPLWSSYCKKGNERPVKHKTKGKQWRHRFEIKPHTKSGPPYNESWKTRKKVENFMVVQLHNHFDSSFASP